ncbi:MAG: tRNA (adenosine(37)-N6)-threonylcarbamoyltransferase complex dimerization subunit type 1 TsaB [Caldithrix sp.]|nr:MAG: tRNA (adenosine(37)-N6)-threonylcarbamoyltransferase complex dimerization subunit type 1 TsaB [Caldithrix sp.]
MKLLTIDTATEICGVALTEDAQLVVDYRLNQKNVHNEKLVSTIQQLLGDIGWQLRDLEGIVFSKGPGSFTGLRIGISVSKGLSFSLGIPIVGVNTLDALAFGAPNFVGKICAVIKAREKEVYFALYENFLNNFKRCSEYEIIHLEKLPEKLNSKILVVSNPPDLVSYAVNKETVTVPPEYSLLKPLTIAGLGFKKFQANEIENSEAAEPFYLKDFRPKRKIYYAER